MLHFAQSCFLLLCTCIAFRCIVHTWYKNGVSAPFNVAIACPFYCRPTAPSLAPVASVRSWRLPFPSCPVRSFVEFSLPLWLACACCWSALLSLALASSTGVAVPSVQITREWCMCVHNLQNHSVWNGSTNPIHAQAKVDPFEKIDQMKVRCNNWYRLELYCNNQERFVRNHVVENRDRDTNYTWRLFSVKILSRLFSLFFFSAFPQPVPKESLRLSASPILATLSRLVHLLCWRVI